MKTRTAAALLACSLAACSDNAANPVAPSAPGATPRPPEPPGTVISSPRLAAIDAGWFDEPFFDELVHGALSGADHASLVLESPETMNVLLLRGVDRAGQCPVGEHSVASIYVDAYGDLAYRDLVAKHTRTIIEGATGRPWRGTVSSTADRTLFEERTKTPGWITIWLSSGDECGGPYGAVACATLGQNPGYLVFKIDPNPEFCFVWIAPGAQSIQLFAHEMGHVLGFRHTSGPHDIMNIDGTINDHNYYTEREARHMNLAYAEGRGAH